MQLETADAARGWVKVGESFEAASLPFVVRGCDLLMAHAGMQFRVRDNGRTVMHVQDGRWVKAEGTGAWRASGWCDLPGFEDTIGARR